jgi:hypothetical protein
MYPIASGPSFDLIVFCIALSWFLIRIHSKRRSASTIRGATFGREHVSRLTSFFASSSCPGAAKIMGGLAMVCAHNRPTIERAYFARLSEDGVEPQLFPRP